MNVKLSKSYLFAAEVGNISIMNIIQLFKNSHKNKMQKKKEKNQDANE